MKTIQDLEQELSATGYEYGIQNLKDGYYLASITYDDHFSIPPGYDLRSFTTRPMDNERAFITFTVKF